MRQIKGDKLPDSRLSSHDASARPAKTSGMFSALRYRNYRLFWTGQLVSVTGTFMQTTAQQWLILTLTSNPLALGVAGALQFGPMLVPFGGAIADRWPRRNVLMATQVASGLLACILWILTVTNIVQLWQVFALAFMLGLVNAVDMPTRQAFVSEMVPAGSLLNAVSLNSAQFNASRILGPGLAGALIALLGVPLLFLLNAVSYIAVIVGLALMRPHELVPAPHSPMGQGVARIRALGDGVRFVLSQPMVRVTFLMVLIIGTFGFNFNILLPLEAKHGLHAGPQVFGLLSSALGIGALIGALALARRGGAPTNRLLVGSALAFGVLEASVAFTSSVLFTMLLIALTGFTMSTFSASANTRTQLSSPPELRGRVMSVYAMVFVGTTPIGNLVVSAMAGSVGVSASFLVSGLPCLLAGIIAAWLWRDSLSGSTRPPTPGDLATVDLRAVPGDTSVHLVPATPPVAAGATANGNAPDAARAASSSGAHPSPSSAHSPVSDR